MNWLDQLQNELCDKPDPVPKGFVTYTQAAKYWKMSTTAAWRRLKSAEKKGLVDVIFLKAYGGGNGCGHLSRQKFYRLKKSIAA